MGAEEIEEPGERVGRGLVAGDEELHAFAENEGVGHAFAVGVAGVHQGLEQVVAGLFVAALADVGEQNLVRVGTHLFVPAQLAGRGEPGIQVGLQRLPDDEFLDGGDGVADEVDVFVLEVGAEERARDHGEGHLHEVGVDVDGAVVDLAVELAQRVGEGVLHDRGQGFELLAVKTLLDEAALGTPGFSVGGEQAFAQEVAHALYLDVGLLDSSPRWSSGRAE